MSIKVLSKKASEPDTAYQLLLTADEGPINLTGLEPNTEYTLKFIRNLVGYNKPSIPTVFTFTTDAISEPTNNVFPYTLPFSLA
jgi:hypothetical protein